MFIKSDWIHGFLIAAGRLGRVTMKEADSAAIRGWVKL